MDVNKDMAFSLANEASGQEWAGGMNSLLDDAHAWLQKRGYSGVRPEERRCCLEPSRVEEAQDMVSHWVMRCGLPLSVAEELDEHLAIRPVIELVTASAPCADIGGAS
jgi:hypothetical protein